MAKNNKHKFEADEGKYFVYEKFGTIYMDTPVGDTYQYVGLYSPEKELTRPVAFAVWADWFIGSKKDFVLS